MSLIKALFERYIERVNKIYSLMLITCGVVGWLGLSVVVFVELLGHNCACGMLAL